MKELDEIRQMKDAYDKKIEEHGKEILKLAFSNFFKKHPEVLGVRWEQYTPYFNDGDVCTFYIFPFTFRTKDTPEDGGDYEDGWEDWYVYNTNNDTATKAAVKKLERDIKEDDVFLAVFGDHVRVTATLNGFDVEEYMHD